MKVKHLDHLNMSVNNFDETKDWYSKVFGFECVEEGLRSGKRWGVLKSGEAHLCIYERSDRRFLDGDQLEEQKVHGLNHFSFRIQDRAQWEEVIRSQNVLIDHTWQYPHSYAWYLYDPTGYEIEVAYWDNDEVSFG